MGVIDRDSDVVIVGAGFAGGPLAAVLARDGIAVTLLERQASYQDVVRGEFLGTWGVAEATRMGLADCLLEGGAWAVRWWRQWDEIFAADEAGAAELTWARTTPQVEGPVSLSYPATCAAFARQARLAGARVEFGVSDVRLCRDGRHPVVRYRQAGREQARAARLVIGAGGRYGQIARQAGIKIQLNCSHWGGGLLVDGLTSWPDDTQAMGTEGAINFIVIPRGGGKARLYLNYDAKTARTIAGPARTANFLKAFSLRSVPGSEEITTARPAGRCASFPGVYSWTDWPLAEGVVLTGDEAGMNDTILGTGLSCSLWDARNVAEILLSEHDWSPAAFRGYAERRAARMACLRRAAAIMTSLYAEFDDQARHRRRRAYELMSRNPAHALFLVVTLAGPDAFPSGPFGDYLADRLLSPA